MIWLFIAWCWNFFKRFWRIPNPEERAFIDPNAKCGCCGATRGSLRTVLMLSTKLLKQDETRPKELRVRRTCAICGASVHFAPLWKGVDLSNTLPSAPRNDVEKADDMRITLQQSA
jgi:hypothetical protein